MPRKTEDATHHGYHHRRVEVECDNPNCTREVAFAEAWVRENETRHTIDALLMQAGGDPTAPWRGGSWCDGVEPSQRDYRVAATVAQWLGTNVGFCWLEETLKHAGYRLERVR